LAGFRQELFFWRADSLNTARKTIRGYEIMRMIKKGQVPAGGLTAAEQGKFIESLFGYQDLKMVVELLTPNLIERVINFG
jgi:hypothetical protein